MYLRVVSRSLQPQDISRRLDAEPDESMPVGWRRHPQARPRSHATWIRHARTAEDDARPEDLEPVVVGWGLDLAEALGRLAASGEADVYLEIVQEVNDIEDPQQRGIFLGPDLMAWLATAGATLDIDQYVYHECGDASGSAVHRGPLDRGPVAGGDPALLQSLDPRARRRPGQPGPASDLGSGASAVGPEQSQDGAVDLVE
ncbi:DUF4279 domain-containing protein [Streptomyces atroolivaceus]|uniref:DUF4279 domain-containing protein n=1 Tax=Streptomyces atroolivaceus TaxID=66869 RepID=UPI00362B3ED7